MLLYVIAYLLFLIGCIGVFLRGGVEFWLWFLAFGVVLDSSLTALFVLGSKRLSFIKQLHWSVVVSHLLALLFSLLCGYFRLKAEMDWFLLFLAISLILWTYSIIKLFNHHRRNK